jgi:hypothetical protein
MLDVLVDLIVDFGADLIDHLGGFKRARDAKADAASDAKDLASRATPTGKAPISTRTLPQRGRRRGGKDDVDVLRVGS